MNKNCIIYSRVSTEQQENESAISELKDIAKYKQLQVIKIFEEKITGTSKATDRIEFKKLLSYIEKNSVDTILVWELSRLGRNLKDMLYTIEYFTDRKINVFAKKEDINTLNHDKSINPTASLTLQIMGSISQYERHTIVERSKRGLRHHLKNGGSFSLPPYGYKNHKKKIVLDESEADIVKEIYELYISGTASPMIAKILNHKNIQTKKGKQWSDVQIRKILQNPMYYGERQYSFGVVDVPAIITKEQFLLVKELFKSNRYKNKDKTVFENYLSNKITCGVCGESYFQHARKNRKDFAYKCMSNRLQTIGKVSKRCGNNGIGINLLNSMVYMAFYNDLMHKNIDKYTENFWNKINQKNEEADKEIEILENEIIKEESKLDRILKLLINQTISEKDYLEQKDIIEKEINRLSNNQNRIYLSKNKNKPAKDTKSIILEFKNGTILTMDLPYYRYMVSNILKSIFINKGDISDFDDIVDCTSKSNLIKNIKNVTKITVYTIFNTYLFFTIKGFHKYTYMRVPLQNLDLLYETTNFPDFELREIEIVDVVSQ